MDWRAREVGAMAEEKLLAAWGTGESGAILLAILGCPRAERELVEVTGGGDTRADQLDLGGSIWPWETKFERLAITGLL